MSPDRKSFRHPPALYLLFATEMWERLSYYGMRALLVLYMTDATRGGLGFSDARALRTYGFYTLGVYLTPLLGGAIADRILGQRRAIVVGGFLMMLGHFLLALPGLSFFYAALALLMVGSGFFKPNISTLVGALYPPEDAHREEAFTIFYMGINLGALLAPLAVGTLGERWSWHLGFGAAGVGMAIGLLTFLALAGRLLGTRGLEAAGKRTAGEPPPVLAREERDRLVVIVCITFFAIFFWAGFEQAGGLVNLFTQRSVDRHLFGLEIPATWFQGAEPAFILLLGAFFGQLWVRLARRPGGGPSTVAKVASGLLGMAIAVVPLLFAARAAQHGMASLWWILGYYGLSTVAELSLSPVALSAVTRLSPPHLVSRMMGVWFISLGAGSYLAGYVGSFAPQLGVFRLFAAVAATLAVAALVLFLLGPWLKRLSHGADGSKEVA